MALKALPRKEFAALQNQVFPSFFLGQTISPVILALTAPFSSTPALVTLGISSVAGAVNYFYLLPKTRKIKEDRFAVEDELKDLSEDEIKADPRHIALSKEFGRVHSWSLLFNFVNIIGLGVYGCYLTKGLRI